MRDVVIYSRVSTEDQKENGFSLQDQERRLREYCGRTQRNILRHYQDDCSGKNFNRPEFQRFLQDVKTKEIRVNEFICVRADRFSRNVHATLLMRETLKSAKIDVVFLENNIDLGIPENLIADLINLALPQVENERRGLNTKQGLRQAMREGRCISRAPKGYYNDRLNKVVKVSDDSRFVIRAFKEVAAQLKPINQIRKELNAEGFVCSKQQFYNLLKNPFYAGYIKIPAWRDEEEELVKGIHEPLVSSELFQLVKKVFENGERRDIRPSKYHNDFPLRGHLECNQCGSKLTASSSKGRNQYYQYYHCQNGCSERHSADLVNDKFRRFLGSFTIKSEVVDLYLEMLKKVYDKNEESNEKKISKLKAKVESLNNSLENLDDKLISDKILIEDYNRISGRLKIEVDRMKEECTQLKQMDTEFDKHVRSGLVLLRDLIKYYDASDVPMKQKIVGSIFPEKLIFDGESYRTSKLNSFVSLISSGSVSCDGSKIEQATKTSGLSKMAPPLGLEPRTL